jgi:hypothetical protein
VRRLIDPTMNRARCVLLSKDKTARGDDTGAATARRHRVLRVI